MGKGGRGTGRRGRFDHPRDRLVPSCLVSLEYVISQVLTRFPCDQIKVKEVSFIPISSYLSTWKQRDRMALQVSTTSLGCQRHPREVHTRLFLVEWLETLNTKEWYCLVCDPMWEGFCSLAELFHSNLAKAPVHANYHHSSYLQHHIWLSLE